MQAKAKKTLPLTIIINKVFKKQNIAYIDEHAFDIDAICLSSFNENSEIFFYWHFVLKDEFSFGFYYNK